MSCGPTTFRPLTRMGWGGKAASHFRGLMAINTPDMGLPFEDPQVYGSGYFGQIGTVVFRMIGVSVNRAIIGVSRDSTGAILGNCNLHLFTSSADTITKITTSDASGNFRFDSPGSGPFYIVAYKAGSPDIAGTTVNTLIAT